MNVPFLGVLEINWLDIMHAHRPTAACLIWRYEQHQISTK